MRPLLLAALALVLLPACGGEDATPDEAAQTGGGAVVDLALTDFAIEPAGIAVDPGSYTFHVVNEGETVHALEVEGPSGEVETPELAPGESADLTVDLSEAGEYEVYCPVGDHRDHGMEGTITVGGGGGGATTDETTTDETTTDETTTDEDSGYRY